MKLTTMFKLLVHLLMIMHFILQIQCRCKVVINEINIIDPKLIETNDYLELKQICNKGDEMSLKGYKVIGFSCGAVSGVIDTVITLWNFKMNKKGFFTAGGVNVKTADVTIPNSMVKTQSSFSKIKMHTMSNFLINPKSEIRAIGLLYDKENSFKDIVLSDKTKVLPINEKLTDVLKKYLVDLVVYTGDKSTCDKSKIIEKIYSDYVGRKYVLREMTVNLDSNDISLNRCAVESSGFLPEMFKLGKPTPGAENDCTGPHFILEDNIPEMTPPASYTTSYLDDTESAFDQTCESQPVCPRLLEPGCSTETQIDCSSSIPRSDYTQTTGYTVLKSIDMLNKSSTANTCTALLLNPNGDQDATIIERENNRKRAISDDADYSEDFEWSTTKYFNDKWLQQIRANHQENLIPIDVVEKSKSWFEYLPNGEFPELSQYRCRLCHKYYDAFGLQKRYKSPLANVEGTLKKDKQENRKTLQEHPKQQSHAKVIEIMQQRSVKRLRKDFEEIQRKEETKNEGVLEITSKMMRTVYMEIKKNIPFDSHLSLVLLQEINGIDMGFHHREKCGATSMMELISSSMHQRLLKHMLSEQLPFSIIVDGSSDISDNHYLSIYFQILEKNVPVVVFYKLVELSSDVTAQGIYTSVKTALQNEDVDLLNYFRTNLVGFASDGEPTMSGQNNGLIALIRKDSKNHIFSIHCMAHRLELIIKHALETNKYFEKFEQIINELFQFYNNNALKRKSHLRETAFKLGKKIYELNYIYHTRWISSEYQAILNFKKMWEVLASDLDNIRTGGEFDQNTRTLAGKLWKRITSRHFMIILNFLADILQQLSFWSQRMQQKTALLVEFSDFKELFIEAFEHLKYNQGRDLALFMMNIVCDEPGCANIDEVYDNEQVEYNNVVLHNDNPDQVPFLHEIRFPFINSIIDQMKSYFPTVDMKAFKIFRPNEFPINAGIAISYGTFEITNICDFLKLGECLDLLKDWGNLVVSITDSESFCKFKDNPKTETYAFWSHFLNEQGISWTARTKRLLQIILVLPVGSAEAERGFSVMNHIKNKRRSRLTPAHMQDLMRIRLNGVDELEKFPAARYAAEFVKNHIKTDDPRWQKKTTSSLEDDDKIQNQKKFLPKMSIF